MGRKKWGGGKPMGREGKWREERNEERKEMGRKKKGSRKYMGAKESMETRTRPSP